MIGTLGLTMPLKVVHDTRIPQCTVSVEGNPSLAAALHEWDGWLELVDDAERPGLAAELAQREAAGNGSANFGLDGDLDYIQGVFDEVAELCAAHGEDPAPIYAVKAKDKQFVIGLEERELQEKADRLEAQSAAARDELVRWRAHEKSRFP